MGQGAGHGNALLLAAGKLIRQAVHLILQANQAEGERYTVLDGFVIDVGHAHGKSHVLVHRHGGDQAEILEHRAHLAAQIRHLAALDGGQVLIVDINFALGGLFFHLDQFEECGFARAGMAQDKNEFPFINVDVDIFQRHIFIILGFIYFGNMFKIDHE